MIKFFVVGFGGFVGALLRYYISGFVQDASKSISFPYGTLAVNVIGCLIIGIMAQLVESRNLFSAEVRLFVFIGLLGGLTTFSTFSHETFNLARDGAFTLALINILVQISLCLSAVLIGRYGAQLIWR